LLGFTTGTVVGWIFARAGLPRTRSAAFQLTMGAIAAAVLGIAWLLALRHA
jgi:hypothetical protein